MKALTGKFVSYNIKHILLTVNYTYMSYLT